MLSNTGLMSAEQMLRKRRKVPGVLDGFAKVLSSSLAETVICMARRRGDRRETSEKLESDGDKEKSMSPSARSIRRISGRAETAEVSPSHNCVRNEKISNGVSSFFCGSLYAGRPTFT